MKGVGMLSGIKQRFNAWRAERRQAARTKELAKVWAGLTPGQQATAKQAAVNRVREQLAALRRAQMMDAARQAFLKDDRVVALPGGTMWWPALAPLKPDERRLVRADLGLKVK